MNILQYGGESLQPHAGINRRPWQRFHVAGGVTVELHEYEVPDFDVAIAILLGGTRRSAFDLGTMVVEYFAAGTTGAGVTHRPEIIRGTDAGEALGIDLDLLEPDIRGFIVLGVNRNPQLFRWQADDVG